MSSLAVYKKKKEISEKQRSLFKDQVTNHKVDVEIKSGVRSIIDTCPSGSVWCYKTCICADYVNSNLWPHTGSKSSSNLVKTDTSRQSVSVKSQYSFSNNSPTLCTVTACKYTCSSNTCVSTVDSTMYMVSKNRNNYIKSTPCNIYTNTVVSLNSAVTKKFDTLSTITPPSYTCGKYRKHLKSIPHESCIVSTIPFYIAGDNYDMLKSPSIMTSDRQRHSWHWFLIISIQKRIFDNSLPDGFPKDDISKKECSSWLQQESEVESYEDNLDYHTVKILVKYFKFLQPLKKCIPEYIDHPYIKEASKKSTFLNCELLDANENTSEGIINIMKHIHDKYVPSTKTDKPHIVEKIDFAGDVLTNERAVGAQNAMLNGDTDYERLSGVNHRPGGLHAVMNLVLVN